MGPSQEPSTIERISIIANASEREGIPRFYYSLRSNVCVCRAKRPHQQTEWTLISCIVHTEDNIAGDRAEIPSLIHIKRERETRDRGTTASKNRLRE